MMVSVAGRRVEKMSEMASLVVQLLPQLKVKTCWTNTHSCSITDLSSPNCARNEASRSGEAFHAGHDFDRISAEKLEQEEDQQNHPQQGGKHLQDASGE